MIDRTIAFLVLSLILTGLVFALWPDLDLIVSRFIYTHGGFWGGGKLARSARDVLRVAPFWLLGLLVVLWIVKAGLGLRVAAPSLAGLIFLVVSLTLGSGIIVNMGLKNHSHRPRPVHIVAFGGQQAFRPWYRFDGACHQNCSFASGEASSGFWMIAPALLTPPPWRAVAIIAGVVYGVASSALRVAFGGHFLSDVLFGGQISLLVTLVLWRFYNSKRR